MDPVLSSTIDFNEYINANLNLAGKKATLSDLAKGRGSKLPTSGAQPQRQQGDRPKSSRATDEYTGKELSQDFQQLNVRKYDKSTAVVPPRSQSARGARPKPPSPEVSPTARIPLQHSWKAHVSSRFPSSMTGTGAVDTRSERITTARPTLWEDQVEDTRPTAPVPYSATSGRSHSNRELTGGSSSTINRPASAALPSRVSVSYDDTEFGLYKVRLVTLKRLFANWTAWCADSQRSLAQRSRDVLENRLYWPKQSAFAWWKLLHRAVQHSQVASMRRSVERLWRNYKMARRRKSLFRRAHRHFEFMKSVQFLRALAVLARRRRKRLLDQGKRLKAHGYRTAKLARRVLTAWKQMVQKAKSDRLLDAEQSARRDKIALFMRRVQAPASSAPAVSASIAPAGDYSEPPPSGRRSGGGTVVSTTAQGRPRASPSSAQAKHTRPVGSTGGAQNTSRVGSAGPRGSIPSAAESKHSDENRRYDAKSTDQDRRERAEEKDAGAEYSDEFEQPDSGGDEGSDNDAPPPSYDALVLPTPPTRSPGGGRAASESFPAGVPAGTKPRTAPGKTSVAHGDSTTNAENTMTVGQGWQETARMTLEERAAARRQRTLLLKKQAEERIQEKSQQKLAAERLKQQKELEEAEMIRKEARAKQQEAKAATDRHRTETVDALRVLLARAKRFRAQQLLVRWGFAPWQQYMELVRVDIAKADNFRADRLLQSAWSAFFGYIVARRTERFRRESRQTALAVAHYRRKLLTFVWRTMRLHHKMLSAKSKALTGHFSRYTLSRRSFLAWRVAYERSIRQTTRKLRSVQPRGDLVSKRHYFRQWCAYHAGMLEEREIRHRVNSKWAAVQSWMS